MIKNFSTIKIFFGVFLFIPSPFLVGAANTSDVVITEIAWMGTVDSYNNEWIEIYNAQDASINLEGWTLRSTDGTPVISLSGIIPQGGFFLLERTDESTLPNEPADQIYTGALGNSGEHLELTDSEGKIIDEVNSWGSWFAGDNTTKQTMERKAPALAGSDAYSWITSEEAGGTPKKLYELPTSPSEEPPKEDDSFTRVSSELPESMQENSIGNEQQIQQMPSASTTESESEKQGEGSKESSDTASTTQPAIEYSENISITEVMPSPNGDDNEMEWIEIKNSGGEAPNHTVRGEAADISSWKIQDILGATNTYEMPPGTTISPNAFLVLSRLTTKITLNNDNDGLSLIRPDGKVAATLSYEKAKVGKSYALFNDVWQWTNVPTPGSANIFVEPFVTYKKEDSPAKAKPIKILPLPQKPTKITNPLPAESNLSSATTTALDAQDVSTTTHSAILQSASLLNMEARDASPWPTFAVGFLIAVFSSVLIFFLRRKRVS